MDWLDFPLQVDPARCLALQSTHSACRCCQEVCPAAAIRLTEQAVVLDEGACLGCGLCLTACPTGALSYPTLSWSDLIARAAGQSREGHLSLGCAYAASTAAMTLPCLGLLDADLLLSLAAQGVRALSLHSAECASCPLGAGPLVEAHLSRAQSRWPDALEVTWQQGTARTTPDLWAALGALAHPPEAAVGRRGFLALVARQAKAALSEPPAAAAPAAEPAALPPSRWTLLRALGRGDGPAFPRYAISPACDDCQDAEALCARFCPSGALQRLRTDDLVGFVFQPELCLACDQCLNLCPQQAIRRADDVPGRGPLLLRRLAVRRCTRCGQEATVLVEGLCPACRRQEQQQAIWTQLVQPPG